MNRAVTIGRLRLCFIWLPRYHKEEKQVMLLLLRDLEKRLGAHPYHHSRDTLEEARIRSRKDIASAAECLAKYKRERDAK